MKKTLLMAMGMLPLFVYGQLTIISDDFESYTAGEPLAANSPLWTTWSGGIASEDGNVSNAQSSSGSNSLRVTSIDDTTDLILPFASNYSSGIYEMTMKVYVVSGFGAYWNYQSSSTPGIKWMFEITFNGDGTGSINAGGTASATFSYTAGEWIDFKIQVNLSSDEAEVWLDGISLHTWQWSLEALGTGNTHTWGGMDVYSIEPPNSTVESDFYVDDVVFSQVFGTGLSEQNHIQGIQVSPNPSNGAFNLAMNNLSAGSYKMEIADMSGRVISSEIININGTINKNLNVDVPAGVYLIKLSNEGFMTTRKIVID